MKKMMFALMMLLAVMVSACSQGAQQTSQTTLPQQVIEEEIVVENDQTEGMMIQDGDVPYGMEYSMVDGKMMARQDGDILSMMTEDVVLEDGTKVMMGGQVQRSNGTLEVLLDGESIREDGTIITE